MVRVHHGVSYFSNQKTFLSGAMYVNVDWTINIDGNKYNVSPWLNKLVLKEITHRDGRAYYILDGNPYCPVRVERCKIVLTSVAPEV